MSDEDDGDDAPKFKVKKKVGKHHVLKGDDRLFRPCNKCGKPNSLNIHDSLMGRFCEDCKREAEEEEGPKSWEVE